jgi:hypothetical protein
MITKNLLYDNLTVFIISLKKNIYEKKKKLLLKEYKKLKIKPIIKTFPMSSAFNQMHLNCKTKYFLQLDEDMFLKKGAIKILFNSIKESNFLTICVAGQLYEKKFGIGGFVKIWKKYIFYFFSFENYRTVDRKFFSKIFPFRKKIIKNIIGMHIPRFNNFSKFSKILGDVCKWKYLNSDKKFVYKMLQNILIDRNYYEIISSLVALNVNKKFITQSKNYKSDIYFFLIIKQFKKFYNETFFLNQKNCIYFFQLFIEVYTEKVNTDVFNKFFLNNILLLNLKDNIKLSKLLNEINNYS